MQKVEKKESLVVHISSRSYGSSYTGKVIFDIGHFNVPEGSWIWELIKVYASDSEEKPCDGEHTRNLRNAILELSAEPDGNRILRKKASQVKPSDLRKLFQLSEEITQRDKSAYRTRGRSAFRTFVYSNASKLQFAEPIDAQIIRYKPKCRLPQSEPRELLSDLHDICSPSSNVPIGALKATTSKDLIEKIKSRVKYDIQCIRTACISDLESGKQIRQRITNLSVRPISKEQQLQIWSFMQSKGRTRSWLNQAGLSPEIAAVAVIKNINKYKLATYRQNTNNYSIPHGKDVRKIITNGISNFTSAKLIEIQHRACVEEIFAAIHLLQTYTGWNWQSMMDLGIDGIDLSVNGFVTIQSFKSKTDDQTPFVTIALNEPGVSTAIELLIWNRSCLIECGFIKSDESRFWVTRSPRQTTQRSGYFHPIQRLHDFQGRHGLIKYSLEQVRTQVLFELSLRKGGLEASRLAGGHSSVNTTQRYVGNVVQDRIASALNLEFSKRLESEIRYLYDGGDRNSEEIRLLRKIGDGSSCIDPANPPDASAKNDGVCSANTCHAKEGCPNRRIYIDDLRMEEVVRLNLYYLDNWQRLHQENPERFSVYIAPNIAFNAALLLAIKHGPYAANLSQIYTLIGNK